MEKQFNYDYHHWGPNKKMMEIINKRGESLKDAKRLANPETFASTLIAV